MTCFMHINQRCLIKTIHYCNYKCLPVEPVAPTSPGEPSAPSTPSFPGCPGAPVSPFGPTDPVPVDKHLHNYMAGAR